MSVYFDIPYQTPKEPNLKKVAGSDLPKSEQYFRRCEIPSYMSEVLCYADYDRDVLAKNEREEERELLESKNDPDFDVRIEELVDEIFDYEQRIKEFETLEKKQSKFIQSQYKKYREGHYFMNNGVVTYITGHHWKFLNHFSLLNADNPSQDRPSYRDNDRESHYAIQAILDGDNSAGGVIAKRRREGWTKKVLSVLLNRSTLEGPRKHGGIQSSNEEKSKKAFGELALAFKNMAWWFKPISAGFDKPSKELRIEYPASKKRSNKDRDIVTVEEVKDRVPRGLPEDIYAILTESQNSIIDQRSATPGAYASEALYTYLSDEVGETKKQYSIRKRLSTTIPCVKLQENAYWGKMFFVGVVDDYDTKTYCCDEFEEMFKNSFYKKINEKTKQTSTGLWSFYQPASDGLSGFYNKYGICDKQAAASHIQETVKSKTNLNDRYAYIRQYSEKWTQAFLRGGGNCPFNTGAINNRLEHFIQNGKSRMDNGNCENPYVVRYDLYWKNGVHPGEAFYSEQTPEVGIRRNDVSGLFYFSYYPYSSQQNKVTRNVGQGGDYFKPEQRHFACVGADPFHFDVVEGKVKSDGGIVAFLKKNQYIDDMGDNIEEYMPEGMLTENQKILWKVAHTSERIFVTYNHRHDSTDSYADDCLKLCWLLGCGIFEERRAEIVSKYFIKNRCQGFLTHDYGKNGKQRTTSGGNSTGDFRSQLFQGVNQYLDNRIEVEAHDDFLEECLIATYKDTGKTDLFIAAAYAIYEAYYKFDQILRSREKKQKVVVKKNKLKNSVYKYQPL